MWGKYYQNFDVDFEKSQSNILSIVKKISNLWWYPKSMANFLSFETNPRVLAQFVKEWQAVRDDYFQVQYRIKNKNAVKRKYQKRC